MTKLMSPLEHRARNEHCDSSDTGSHDFIAGDYSGHRCDECGKLWNRYWQPIGLSKADADVVTDQAPESSEGQ